MSRKLFKDDSGFMVDVENPDSDHVGFCAQGGGFMLTMPHSLFHATFTPAKMPGYKLSQFTLEWWPDYEDHPPIPGYSNGQHWNGWAVPYFTLENALEVANRMSEAIRFDPTTSTFWVNDQDDPDYPDGYPVVAELIEVDGQPVKVWQLVSGWCWDEVSK